MLSYIRPEDNLWEVPVVVFIVWTLVLLISSLIVLSCLRRETKKFAKRLSKADNKDDLVRDIPILDSIMARYVEQTLKLGVLQKMANSYSNNQGNDEAEILKSEARHWFKERVEDLSNMNYTEKNIKRIMLGTVRSGLTQHPLDLRGSRRSLEAARIFLEMKQNKEQINFLDTKVSTKGEDKKDEDLFQSTNFVCPTSACQWIAAKVLQLMSLTVRHPNTIPLFFVFLSFIVWLYDCITDMVMIQLLWSYNLPIMYPNNDTNIKEMTNISYQTLTVDLYAPLLLLILLFSLMFTLLSCSCSRLSDRYRLSADYARPLSETSGVSYQDPTTILARYDFQLGQAVTASLPQCCLQFSAYMMILYMLETLKGSTPDEETLDLIQKKIDNFTFSSLWFSGIGSGVSLVVAQYTAFKIQHEHGLTLGQRIVYFFSCLFNTIAMMTSCVVLVTVVLLPVSTYVGRYHMMILVVLGVTAIGIAALVSLGLSIFSLDPATITTDRVVTRFQTSNLLTAFLRFSQIGRGHWETLLGATTIIGKVFSLLTVNLFLPPSQLLVHPFQKFYANSPRSPALHSAIAKQLVYYNIILLISSIMLCIDINEYGFNYSLTTATRNLLVWANFTGVPCIFISLFILFKFYSTHDLWTSNGVHLVFHQDLPTIISSESGDNTDNLLLLDQTEVTSLDDQPNDETNQTGDKNVDKLGDPQAESTIINTEEISSALNEEEQNESTEADRNHLSEKGKKKKKVIIIKKQTLRLNKKIQKAGGCCSFVVDAAQVETGGGKWVNVSD